MTFHHIMQGMQWECPSELLAVMGQQVCGIAVSGSEKDGAFGRAGAPKARPVLFRKL